MHDYHTHQIESQMPRWERQPAFAVVLALVGIVFVIVCAWTVAHFVPTPPAVPTAEELRLQAVSNAAADARAQRASEELGVTVTPENLVPPMAPAAPPAN